MVKRLLGLALLLSPFAAAAAHAEPWRLERSDVLTAQAPDGHAYRVLVAWPDGPPPAAGWPVLWVLDGEDNFAIAAMTARRMARAGARSGIEPGLVVGIDSGPLARRIFDYTPAAPGYAIPAGAPAHGHAVGGADAFLSVLNRQIRPAIESRWRIDPARQTLLGHSFGGLLGLHALFAGQPFAGFVVVSPSLWYGNGILDRAERASAAKAARVLIAGGASEAGPNGQSGAAAEALAARLRARGLDARYRELPGESHGTTMLAAMGHAVGMAFGRVLP